MLGLLEDNKITKWPLDVIDLRVKYPNTSFPDDISSTDLTSYGVVTIQEVSQPSYDSKTQKIAEDDPVLDGETWKQSWTVTSLTSDEITAINTKMCEQGYYKKRIKEIMKIANNLTYGDHKGFVNIIQAQRRGLIPSDVLDTAEYAHIYARLKQAYSQAKKYAENNLDDPILSGIREREYEIVNSKYNQKAGNLDQVYQDAGLQETLNMYK